MFYIFTPLQWLICCQCFCFTCEVFPPYWGNKCSIICSISHLPSQVTVMLNVCKIFNSPRLRSSKYHTMFSYRDSTKTKKIWLNYQKYFLSWIANTRDMYFWSLQHWWKCSSSSYYCSCCHNWIALLPIDRDLIVVGSSKHTQMSFLAPENNPACCLSWNKLNKLPDTSKSEIIWHKDEHHIYNRSLDSVQFHASRNGNLTSCSWLLIQKYLHFITMLTLTVFRKFLAFISS